MAEYYVRIPITGYIGTEVEADSEKEAIEKALNRGLTSNNIEE